MTDLSSLFGNQVAVKDLQRNVLTPSYALPSVIPRGIMWRVFLGILPAGAGISSWAGELERQRVDYYKLKEDKMPSLVKVAADPLSGLASDSDSGSAAGAGGEAEAGDEWTAYYKNVELSNFINGDLDRLYMNGIDDEYFQKPERRQILLNVLLLWALLHKKTSYRQGMHELAGPILFVLEEEMRDPSLAQFRFSESSLEAHTFLLFSRIMQDLELLYDPSPSPHGSDKQPQVVAFCSRIQDSALRKLDPLLCAHLEASYVQAQLYGMRWCRLLFGREFPLTPSLGLRIWDFLFASCLDLGPASASASQSEHGVGGPLASTALLGAVADLVLAMLLFVREDLLSDDNNVTMGVLMHYPPVESVSPILDVADMLKRGVLQATMGSGSRERTTSGSGSAAAPKKRGSAGPPAWLLRGGAASSASPVPAPEPTPALPMPAEGSLASLLGNLSAFVADPLGSVTSPVQATQPKVVVAPSIPPPAPAPAPSPAPSPAPAPAPVPVPATPPPVAAAAAAVSAAATKAAAAAAATSLLAAKVSDRLSSLGDALSRAQSVMVNESDLRQDTARKVRMLANVLAGLASVDEYDALSSR